MNNVVRLGFLSRITIIMSEKLEKLKHKTHV